SPKEIRSETCHRSRRDRTTGRRRRHDGSENRFRLSSRYKRQITFCLQHHHYPLGRSDRPQRRRSLRRSPRSPQRETTADDSGEVRIIEEPYNEPPQRQRRRTRDSLFHSPTPNLCLTIRAVGKTYEQTL